MKEDIKVLEKFINNYKLIQEKYKDDEIQAEIEKSCYFEEVPAQAIENLIKGYKELKDKNNNVSDRLEYYLIDNFAIMENPNKVKEEFERLLNMLQEGDK